MTIEEQRTAQAIQAIASELRRPKPIDWELRRYEIARDMMAALISNPLALQSDVAAIKELGMTDQNEAVKRIGKTNAQEAVIFADALIEELKKK